MSEEPASKAKSVFRRPGRMLASAAGVLLLWRIFTDSRSLHELSVGAVCTALSILFLANVLRTENLRLHFHLRDLLQLWRVPWYILSGSWEITWLLLKDLAGKPTGSFYRDCGFKTSSHDPTLVERTVLAIVYTTAAPNFIIIGVDAEQSLMLFHQIKRSSVPKMTQALGAQQ